MPQVFNDEVIIPGQLRRGIAPEDARNYAVVGCVELSTPGKALGWSDAAMFNMTRVLELTLFGGQDPQSGEQIGLATPPLDQMRSLRRAGGRLRPAAGALRRADGRRAATSWTASTPSCCPRPSSRW